MVLLTLFLYLLIVVQDVAADVKPSVGVAALASGSKKFPCGKKLRFLKDMERPYLSTLWGTFGKSKGCWKSYVNNSADRSHTIQFYMSNESCRRKGNCSKTDFLPDLSVDEYNASLERERRGIIKKVKRQMKRIKGFCDRSGNPNTTCLLALGLESQFTEEALDVLVNTAMSVGWDYTQIVHNPVKTAPYVKVGSAYYLELHARNPRFRIEPERSIASLDGINPSFCRTRDFKDTLSITKLKKWYERLIGRTAYVAFWCAPHQGLREDSLFAPEPIKRTFKVRERELKLFRTIISDVDTLVFGSAYQAP